ncbi:transposase [Streptomyces anulatus]|uniref:transposase n=1 Tax=Streptomyces anulatus TaxID=1892 RepID=UPI001C5D976B|nr:transposase [Streptomyces anulatus]QYA98293.1 transposase [Streptomyces anulatus]
MIRRHELSDAEWEFVRPLLPVSLRGRKRLDDRRVLNGIVWKFRTGTAWRDVPERYGPWATLHTRFRRWATDGTFERMLRAAQAKADVSKAIRTWLRRRIPHTIPERADQIGNRARRGSRVGRPPTFDREVYKHRNVVERCFNRLKQWRGIATRYDKTIQSYEAAVTLASLLMWA